MDFLTIEAERLKRNIPMARLCAAAGLDIRSYGRIRTGERVARPDTLARLAAGLSQLKRGERQIIGKASSRMLFRLVLGQLALLTDTDLKTVMEFNPQLKATADPKWMEISRLRNIACYMLNTVLGIPNAEVARAAGVSPPAITIALAKLEIKRDDPDLDRIFSMLETAVQG